MLGLFPHGMQAKRYWGMFQMPTTNGPGGPFNGSSDTMWNAFNFNADFKAPIDAMKAAGANLFVGFGSWGFMASGSMTLAQYIARRKQLMDYLLAQGIYYLPYGWVTQSQWNGVTQAQAQTALAADCQLLGGYANLLGYVTFDEPIQGTTIDAPTLALVSAMYGTAKANLPAHVKVCGCPNPMGNANPMFSYAGNGKTNTDAVAPYCDCFAYHPFATVTPSDSDAVRASYPSKMIRLPSAVFTAYNSGSLPTIVNSIMGVTRKNQFDLFGWFATVDLVPGDNTGFFDASYAPHAAALTLFQANM